MMNGFTRRPPRNFAALGLALLFGFGSEARADGPVPELIPLGAITQVGVLGCEEVYLSGECRLPVTEGDITLSFVVPGLHEVAIKLDGKALDPESDDDSPGKGICGSHADRRVVKVRVAASGHRIVVTDESTHVIRLNVDLLPPWTPNCASADAKERVACFAVQGETPDPTILERVLAEAGPTPTQASARAGSLLARYKHRKGDSEAALGILEASQAAHEALKEVRGTALDAQMSAHLQNHLHHDFNAALKALNFDPDFEARYPLLTFSNRFYRATILREAGHLVEAQRLLCRVESDASYAGIDTEALNAVTARAVALIRLGSATKAHDALTEASATYDGASVESQAVAKQNLAAARLDIWLTTKDPAHLKAAREKLEEARANAERDVARPMTLGGMSADLADMELFGDNLDGAQARVDEAEKMELELEHRFQIQIVRAEIDLRRGRFAEAKANLDNIMNVLHAAGVGTLAPRATALRARPAALLLGRARGDGRNAAPRMVADLRHLVDEALDAAREDVLLSPLAPARGRIPPRIRLDLGTLAEALAGVAPDAAIRVIGTMTSLDIFGVGWISGLIRENPSALGNARLIVEKLIIARARREDAFAKDDENIRCLSGDKARCSAMLYRSATETREADHRELGALEELLASSVGQASLPRYAAPPLGPGEASLALAVTPSGILGALSAADTVTVRLLTNDIIDVARGEYSPAIPIERRKGIADEIIHAFEDRLRGVHLLRITAEGPLHDLPFGAATLSTGGHLYDWMAVLYSLGLEPRAGTTEPLKRGFIAYDTLTGNQALPDAHAAARKIRENLSRRGMLTTSMWGTQVSSRELRTNLEQADVALLIVHGVQFPNQLSGYWSDDPLLNGFMLRHSDDGGDLVFDTRDVLTLARPPRMVFLGVCFGDASTPSGYGISPAEAFLVKGSEAVVASPETLHLSEIRWIMPAVFQGPVTSAIDLAEAIQKLQIAHSRSYPGVATDLDLIRVEVP